MIVEKFDSYEFALVGYWHLNAVWQAVMSACPYLYYNNAKAAKDWMVDVLGFETGFTVEDKDGTIGHAGRPEDEPSIETSIMPASLLWDPHRNFLNPFHKPSQSCPCFVHEEIPDTFLACRGQARIKLHHVGHRQACRYRFSLGTQVHAPQLLMLKATCFVHINTFVLREDCSPR